MNFRTCSQSLLYVILLIMITLPLQAQDSTVTKNKGFSISKGTILTGFSLDGVTASRDEYNHEFERAFSRLRFNVEGMYFISDRIGVGPIVGYEYLYQDFEDPTNFFDPKDRWYNSFLYGAKAGWYIPLDEIISAGSDNNIQKTYLFLNGGVSWLWNKNREEDTGTIKNDNRFGYQLSSGLLVPVGENISLEWKLSWEARREHYQYGIIQNGQVVQEFDETKWLKEFSVGLGLKVIF